LELDLKWLALAGASEPLTLKNVYIQNQFVPVSTADEISVTVSGNIKKELSLIGKVSSITEEMTQGIRPAHLVNPEITNPKLVLLHGYCSASNPWNENGHASDFTDAAYFVNPSASITNDAFARLVIKFVEDSGIDSFSLIGHSQGGCVATHIHNYYWTGLENPLNANGKKIQTVGTPYQGTSIAGSSADMGKSFGIGCGSNYDLSHDGAALWLTGITSTARSDVSFYTTQYSTGGLINYCNLAVNLLLDWPNDGTTEYDYSSLSGAKNMGHLKGWCHTTGMNSEPQYWDGARNKIMNAAASR